MSEPVIVRNPVTRGIIDRQLVGSVPSGVIVETSTAAHLPYIDKNILNILRRPMNFH